MGLIVTDNNKLIIREETNFETLNNVKEKIYRTIIENKICEILHYGEKDRSFFPIEKIDDIKIRDIQKIVFTQDNRVKNEVFAKSLNIVVEYTKLHSPLYDIQLSYQAYAKYLNLEKDEQQYISSNAKYSLCFNPRDIHKPRVEFKLIHTIVNNFDDF
jgi:hypothetical protein